MKRSKSFNLKLICLFVLFFALPLIFMQGEAKKVSAINQTAVTLDANYAGGEINGSLTLNSGDNVATDKTLLPARNGYNLIGYFLETSCETQILDKNGNVLSGSVSSYIEDGRWIYSGAELTLYAGWQVGVSTVTINYYRQNVNGVYTDIPYKTVRTSGTTDTIFTLQESDYLTFAGFDFDQSLSVESGNVDADGTLELKLYYKRKSFTVTWLNHDGTLITTSSALYDSAPNFTGNLTPPQSTQSLDLSFYRWENAETEEVVESVTANVTLIAKYKINMIKSTGGVEGYLITADKDIPYIDGMELVIKKISGNGDLKLDKNQKAKGYYSIGLFVGSQRVVTGGTGTMTIIIKVDNLKNGEIAVRINNENSNATNQYKGVVENGYLTFTTRVLGDFATAVNINNSWVKTAIIIGVFAVLAVALVIVYFKAPRFISFSINGRIVRTIKTKYNKNLLLPSALDAYKWYADKECTKYMRMVYTKWFTRTVYGISQEEDIK